MYVKYLLAVSWTILLMHNVVGQKDDGDKDGWSCVNGYWVGADGIPSEYPCDEKDGDKDDMDSNNGDKKGNESKTDRCNDPDIGDQTPLADMERSCLNLENAGAGKGPHERCWWTYDPRNSNPTELLPLVIDMHGGGGCASDQASSSGFRELSASAENRFVVAYPQAHLSLWASCGVDFAECQAEKDTSPEWDDVQFLEQLIVTMVANAGVDPERVYVTGFSLGCMMAHRFALERGRIVAGMTCHGGRINGINVEGVTVEGLLNDQKRLDIQPVPILITGGDQDAWFRQADFDAWSVWNGCDTGAAETITSSIADVLARSSPSLKDTNAKTGNFGQPMNGTLQTRATCRPYQPTLKTKMVTLLNGNHVPDPRMAVIGWEFLKQFRRVDALSQLPEPVSDRYPSAGSSRSLSLWVMLLVALWL